MSHPSVSWGAAFGFFLRAVGSPYQDVLEEARRACGPGKAPDAFQVISKRLRLAERHLWRLYLESRIRAKHWDVAHVLRRLRCLPRTMPQAHRWFLAKVHLNAPLTSGRVASAGLTNIGPCPFCKMPARDSWEHILRCDLVVVAYDDLWAAGHLSAFTNAQPLLFMQTDLDGAAIVAIVAVFASVWRLRAACVLVDGTISREQLRDLLGKCLDCPWLVRCMPTLNRQARRRDRLREPPPVPGSAIYRSDGGSRAARGGAERLGGFGCAFWLPTDDGLGVGTPHATCYGFLGMDISNNVAEYQGVLSCLRRASRSLDRRIVLQVDSLLVAQQLAPRSPWACRNTDLIPLRDACRVILQDLADRGIDLSICHIYREFNTIADSLATRAIDEHVLFASNGNL